MLGRCFGVEIEVGEVFQGRVNGLWSPTAKRFERKRIFFRFR